MFSSQVLVLDCFVSDFCRVSITIHEKACAITCNKIVHEIDNKVSEVPDIIFLYFFYCTKISIICLFCSGDNTLAFGTLTAS